LFDFLSNEGVKFAKSVERLDEDMKMMPPQGAWRPFGPRGRHFWRPDVIVRDHICCASLTQINTSQRTWWIILYY